MVVAISKNRRSQFLFIADPFQPPPPAIVIDCECEILDSIECEVIADVDIEVECGV